MLTRKPKASWRHVAVAVNAGDVNWAQEECERLLISESAIVFPLLRITPAPPGLVFSMLSIAVDASVVPCSPKAIKDRDLIQYASPVRERAALTALWKQGLNKDGQAMMSAPEALLLRLAQGFAYEIKAGLADVEQQKSWLTLLASPAEQLFGLATALKKLCAAPDARKDPGRWELALIDTLWREGVEDLGNPDASKAQAWAQACLDAELLAPAPHVLMSLGAAGVWPGPERLESLGREMSEALRLLLKNSVGIEQTNWQCSPLSEIRNAAQGFIHRGARLGALGRGKGVHSGLASFIGAITESEKINEALPSMESAPRLPPLSRRV